MRQLRLLVTRIADAQHGQTQSRVNRLPSMLSRAGRAGATVTIAMGILLLLFSASAGLRGDDFDDDDCCPVTSGPPVVSAVGALSAVNVETVRMGCPETYLGNISGVHWYDVWKTFPQCWGHIIEGVPHNEYIEVCEGDTCDEGIQYEKVGVVETGGLQPDYGKYDDKLLEKDKVTPMPNQPYEDGYAQVDTPEVHEFRLLTLQTTTRPYKTRRIGVEVPVGTAASQGQTPMKATWSAEKIDSKVQHFIDVKFNYVSPTEYEEYTYRVTTVNEVPHD